MTDKEALLELLKRFGITPEIGTFTPPEPNPHNLTPSDQVTLTAHQGDVDGYSGFFTVFDFTPEGKFEQVGVWE
jgi:hypothetical protein